MAETTIGYILEKPTFVFAQRGADVEFPLPYFSTYTEIQPEIDHHFEAIRSMVQKISYQHEIDEAWIIRCPYRGCEAESKTLTKPVTFIKKCPVCARPIIHEEGRQLIPPTSTEFQTHDGAGPDIPPPPPSGLVKPGPPPPH